MFDEDIIGILTRARRIGTIIPRKIVPVVVAFRHGPERGYGDERAARTPCEKFDARGLGGPSRRKFALSWLH
jgi:hypothetical protein